MQTHSSQSGATLIEALISILVMSIGLLGIAGLQINAIAYQKSAWSTQRVAEVSTDFAERLRGNPTAAKNGSYVYNSSYATSTTATLSSNDCRTPSTYCSTASLAEDDVTALLTKARALLPGGSAQVEGSYNSGFILTVMYRDKDFINPTTGAAMASATCAASTTGVDWRNCCPTTAAVPDGVRCRRLTILP
jgi:type IV pilus assembly protein PilV